VIVDQIAAPETDRGIVVARLAAAMPPGLGEVLEDYERRWAAFERVTDAQARASDLAGAAARALAELATAHA
jgi:hypothetical protein